MIECAEREIGFRQKCYPRWVTQNKLTQTLADLELARMKSIHRLLVGLEHAGRHDFIKQEH
jgi:hypothetical protein